jgi:hypothetical protein
VEVSIFLGDHSGSKGYLVVYDNGCGMDRQRILAFATYALCQEDRGLAPSEDNGP